MTTETLPRRAGPTARLRQRVTASRRGLGEHWLFGCLLLVAVVLRAAVHLAYRPALIYPDSGVYVYGATVNVPNYDRPYGYSLLLRLLLPVHSVEVVSLVQHLMGLALVVAGYLVLVRRGVRRWLAVVGVAPVALDARQLVLEHFVLAETQFTFLLGLAVLLLIRRQRPATALAAVIGLLVASAALTRSVGLPMIGLLLLWLLVRRVRPTALAASVVAAALPLAGYLGWYHETRGVYAFGEFDGRFLYARTATFVDCDRIRITEQQRGLCPTEPVGQRPQRNDEYIWRDRTAARTKYFHVRYDPFLKSFALSAIRQQPLDYLATVARETGWHFAPSLVDFDEGQRCLSRAWQLPVRETDGCQTTVFSKDRLVAGEPVTYERAEWLRPALRAYSKQGRLPGPVLPLVGLVAIAAAVWRPRRPGWADGRDALLCATTGLGLIVASVATSMYDPRYATPAVFFVGLAGALGVHRLAALRLTAGGTSSPTSYQVWALAGLHVRRRSRPSASR